jgi:uncharacterized protein
MVTSLFQIAASSIEKENENDAFTNYLAQQDEELIDALVANLNNTIEPKIDCTTCGSCCKTLMINVTEAETKNLSQHLQESIETIKERYLEKGLGDTYIINKMPCHFLLENKCSIYENRFAGCREFPALHKPHFTQRLFTVFMHYGRCPIIFNVVEALKKETGFLN